MSFFTLWAAKSSASSRAATSRKKVVLPSAAAPSTAVWYRGAPRPKSRSLDFVPYAPAEGAKRVARPPSLVRSGSGSGAGSGSGSAAGAGTGSGFAAGSTGSGAGSSGCCSPAKRLVLLVVLALSVSLLAGCGGQTGDARSALEPVPAANEETESTKAPAAYSDGIAQALHLFPYSPPVFRTGGTGCFVL